MYNALVDSFEDFEKSHSAEGHYLECRLENGLCTTEHCRDDSDNGAGSSQTEGVYARDQQDRLNDCCDVRPCLGIASIRSALYLTVSRHCIRYTDCFRAKFPSRKARFFYLSRLYKRYEWKADLFLESWDRT